MCALNFVVFMYIFSFSLSIFRSLIVLSFLLLMNAFRLHSFSPFICLAQEECRVTQLGSFLLFFQIYNNLSSGFMIKQFDHLYKTVIIGNSGVGKSSILIRFAENQFSDNYLATIGVDFRFKKLQVDQKNIKFQIWDTAGQERFRTITSAYYRGSQAILLVFDLTDQQSFADICNFWMGEVQEYAQKDALLILVGNKSDLPQKKVTQEQIDKVCKEKSMKYVECSAKQDDKVKDIFSTIARILMKREELKNMTPAGTKGTGLGTKKVKGEKKNCC